MISKARDENFKAASRAIQTQDRLLPTGDVSAKFLHSTLLHRRSYLTQEKRQNRVTTAPVLETRRQELFQYILVIDGFFLLLTSSVTNLSYGNAINVYQLLRIKHQNEYKTQYKLTELTLVDRRFPGIGKSAFSRFLLGPLRTFFLTGTSSVSMATES